MDTAAVTRFLSLLAVVAEIATVAGIVLALGGRRLREQAVAAIAPSALPLAAVVATVCMAGSLYFSEIAHYPPCKLCWYQRIAMYPLVPLLGIAAWRRDVGIRVYAAVLAGAGGAVSIFHILVERDIIHEAGACDPTNPCNIKWVNDSLGYLTIPGMALSGFLLILTLLAVSRAGDRLAPSDEDEQSRSEVHGHR